MHTKLLTISCGLILFPLLAWGNNYVVRPDCPNNGAGTSWTCASSPGGPGAYNTLPLSASITRGDTIYVGGGTITFSGEYPLDKAVSGTSVITIKKAVAAEHGLSTGWSDSYGSGQTIFKSGSGSYGAVFRAMTGYYSFDGVTNGGANPDNYGFKITYGYAPPGGYSELIWDAWTYGPAGYTFKNMAFVNVGTLYDVEKSCINGGFSDTLIQNNYFADSQNFIAGMGSNVTVEGNYFKNNTSTSAHHGEAMTVCPPSGFVVRNNIFNNAINGTCGIGCQYGSSTMTGWKIYNNIVIGGNGGNGFVSNNEVGTTTVNLMVYNNTFVDTNATTYIKGPSSSGNKISNNFYYNSSGTDANCAGCTYSYNYYTAGSTVPASAQPGKVIDTADPFVAKSAMDYRLLSTSRARNAGIDLGVPYNIDFFGVLRPSGGAWDVGAIQGGFGGAKRPFWPTIAPIQ